MLPQSIMQILSDASPFTLGDFKNLLLQPLALLFHGRKPTITIELTERSSDDRRNELLKLSVFRQVVERATFHHLHCDALISLSRDNNKWNKHTRVREMIDDLNAF